jgi:iron complex transport system ATP-binding protein
MSLEARDLDYGYPKHRVGAALSLTLAPGEVLCLLGPNGSGKTTLLKTLLGLLPPLGGAVRLEGQELARWSARERATRLAYVPQAAESYFDFSLLETVEMGRSVHRGAFARPGRRDREAAQHALQKLGIAALAQQPIHRVSGGERQLALIARALATEARMLVMDEPTASLDFGNQSRVLEEIARLRNAGIGILLCSHDPDHAFQVADRVVLLQRGGVLAAGRAGEILTAAHLSRLYGVGVHVAEVETPSGSRRICVPLRAARDLSLPA